MKLIGKPFVSFREMETKFNKVRKELTGMGLLYDRSALDDVDCIYEVLSKDGFAAFVGAMGLYRFISDGDGNIHIPALYFAGLLPSRYEDRQILDVIRHEFGHALADRYERHFRGSPFRPAFGANYGETKVFKRVSWEDRYVTEYATDSTQEDFAETFMLFMKYKGKLPARYRGKCAIEKKWDAVRQIIKEISVLAAKESRRADLSSRRVECRTVAAKRV